MTAPDTDLQLHDATIHLLHSAAMQFARVANAVAAGDATPELLEARQQELQVAACAFAEVAQGGVLAGPYLTPHADLLPPELSPALRGRLLRLMRRLSLFDAQELLEMVGAVEDETMTTALTQEERAWRAVAAHLPGLAATLDSIRAHVDGFDGPTDDCPRCSSPG
ncbi:MAG TPA: hypothetical protein VII06_22290 [Chloroflexota bacterium]|jgi:hypothetical protein